MPALALDGGEDELSEMWLITDCACPGCCVSPEAQWRGRSAL